LRKAKKQILRGRGKYYLESYPSSPKTDVPSHLSIITQESQGEILKSGVVEAGLQRLRGRAYLYNEIAQEMPKSRLDHRHVRKCGRINKTERMKSLRELGHENTRSNQKVRSLIAREGNSRKKVRAGGVVLGWLYTVP